MIKKKKHMITSYIVNERTYKSGKVVDNIEIDFGVYATKNLADDGLLERLNYRLGDLAVEQVEQNRIGHLNQYGDGFSLGIREYNHII